MKYQRGVTLVTLVITVLILFILAGTAFTLLNDDEGILEEAQITQESSELKSLKDSVKAMYSEYKTWSDNGLGKELEVYLNTIENATVQKVADDTYYVKRGNSQVTVYDDGDIYEEEIWDGGTECPVFKEFNWYIYTPSQLKFFADFVNNGNSLAEGQAELLTNAGYRPEDVKMEETTIVYLMNNLDLGARPTDGNWNTTENESKKWIAIGNVKTNSFIGIFEGNHKTIKGVYVNQTANFAGLFGYATNTIQNVSIKDSYIEGTLCMGGITGSIKHLTNCHNINTTIVSKEGNYNIIGGITGQILTNSGTTSNCTNSGKIIAHGIDSQTIIACGGIVGGVGKNNTIINCDNRGEINARGKRVGGIIGSANGFNTVINCNNYATVIGNGTDVGGIVGVFALSTETATANSSIEKCYNSGYISAENGEVGGIVGTASNYTLIGECKNDGKVSTTSNYAGGIVGELEINSSISKSINTGTIKGQQHVGGIAGILSQEDNTTNSKIEKCYNSGNVTGEAKNVGGIVGLIAGSSSQATVESCYNKGVITGTDRIGEIAGYQANRTGLNTLNKLFYLKKSKNLTAIGTEADNVEKQIISVSDDLTPEQFFTWIESK